MGRHGIARGAQSRLTRRVVAGASAIIGIAALSVALSPNSSAAALLPSTTTVKATPATAGLDRNVHLTATVKVLNLGGAVIFPTGTVTFSTVDGVLGTAPVTPCAVIPCTASLDTTQLPLGTNVVEADWSGDKYGKPSSGTVKVIVDGSSYSNKSTVTCQKNVQTCDAGLIESADGGTWTDLFLNQAPTQNHTVTESLGGTPLKCADANAGALSTFTDTPDVVAFKTLYYTVTDPTESSNLFNAWNEHPNFLGCYASNKPFTNGATGGPAKLTVDGGNLVYEAPLPSCYANGFAPPCFVFHQGQDQYGNESETANTVEVDWEQGTFTDPKFIG